MTIEALRITNFKCFQDLRLSLAQLSLFTGYNAAGKSTALQGLLLLAQACRWDPYSNAVPLAGQLVRLGLPGDLLSASATARSIRMGIQTTEDSITWELEPGELAVGLLKVKEASLSTADGECVSWQDALWPLAIQRLAVNAEHLRRLLSEIIVISAVRSGPSDAYPVPDDAGRFHADVGVEGQFAPWWLARSSDDEVDEERRHPLECGTSFRRQLDAYLGDLFPGAQVNAEQISRTAQVRLELRTSSTGEWIRPANIGYGLTYAFPILTALLAAKKGQVVIIDSPEAHLHPSAQSAMGRLLARIASAGVQVIVETHSDHVLNGVRLAIRDKIVSPNEVAIHFFAGPAEGTHGVSSLHVDSNGSIESWPEGFFDQSERDLTQLAGWE
jgi:predicted ATPase